MQTKHLCVLIHIWTKGEVGALLNRFKPSSKISLLTVQRRCFFCGSFLSCFLILSRTSVCWCLVVTCWPLGARLWCPIMTLSLTRWYPGSGVVLDCIDSCICPLSYYNWLWKQGNWPTIIKNFECIFKRCVLICNQVIFINEFIHLFIYLLILYISIVKDRFYSHVYMLTELRFRFVYVEGGSLLMV